MSRMKTLFMYLLVFVLIYIIFDFFSYRYLVNSYKNIKTYEITAKSPEVKIEEAKATAVNGYVKLKVKNTTNRTIEKTNIQLDLYNSRGNKLGTKYAKIENFSEDQVREYQINFRATNITHIKVSFTDENVDEQIAKQAEELSQEINRWLPFAGLITLILTT